MKRFFISFSGIVAIVLFFSLCYYISFQNTVKQLEDMKSQQSDILPELLADGDGKAKGEYQEIAGASEVKEVSAEEDIITADTVCVYKTYYIDNGEELQYEAQPGADIAGLTRIQLSDKLEKYMDNLSVMEYEAGLISYEVLSFSPERVVLQKVYDREKVRYKYYVMEKNDAVVVFYSDKKTVFEYTGILLSELDEDIREALQYGIPVKDVEELYDFLSGITS